MPNRHISFALAALFLLFSTATPPSKAHARPVTAPTAHAGYQQAFDALSSKNFQAVRTIIARGGNTVLNDILRGALMEQPGNDYSFHELATFISDHADWPGLKGVRMMAEQKIPETASSETIINWFNAHPPLTAIGFDRYIDALNGTGQSQKAAQRVRDWWTNEDMTESEITAFYARFSPLLTDRDHRARLNRLLWENNISAARAMYSFIDGDAKALAEARLALANQLSGSDSLVDRVPPRYRNDEGLMFERLRAYRKDNDDEDAINILLRAPEQLSRPDKWWDERHILIRRLLEKHDYKMAYRLSADHGLDSGFDYAQAEFMAGWLALRFLHRADIARKHFADLYENCNTPISRARAAYWLGRSLDALKDKIEAEQAYQTAAALNTTFYGQLAIARLSRNPIIAALPEPAIPANVKKRFYARDTVLAIEYLARIGQTDRARAFFKAVADNATQRAEFSMLADLAYKLQRPDWAIVATKAASQKNMLIGASAFPVLSMRLPTPPDPAFTHALIRQESLFYADATSSSGARGMMQLLPGTARDTAKKLDIRYSESRLSDPSYNLKLGTAYVQEQLDKFDGSIILALAAYNAGPRRAREWMELFGDPRSPQVDPVDWIELIPVYETRNYVQRIVENLQFYRARLNGGRATLTILDDLRK